jgi:Fic family protein
LNEVTGYAKAAQWVYSQALEPDAWSSDKLISLNELRRIHHTAMTAVWEVAPHEAAGADEGPGNWRRRDIRPCPGGMTPPPGNEVPARITTWVDEVNATGAQLRAAAAFPEPLPEQLARLHNLFERVHPFFDGNGRAGRLALNLMLVRLSYPPVIIFKKQRDAYLTALGKADSDDFGSLGELIARAMLDNINRFIVPTFAGPASGPVGSTSKRRLQRRGAAPSGSTRPPRRHTGRRRHLAHFPSSRKRV